MVTATSNREAAEQSARNTVGPVTAAPDGEIAARRGDTSLDLTSGAVSHSEETMSRLRIIVEGNAFLRKEVLWSNPLQISSTNIC